MIRNEYFTGSDGYNSLPIFITLMQYNDNWNVPTYTFNHNITTTSTPSNIVARSSGTLGGSATVGPQFQFTFDCIHETVVGQNLEDPFASINNELANNNFPSFAKERLKKEYIILSIPDVGQESKTLGYRDFVPQVWYNGKKIWQRYIGLIRNYTSKTAYILIPRKKINLNVSMEDPNPSDFFIRCVWKNNIEDFEPTEISVNLKPNKDSTVYSTNNIMTMFWNKDHYEMTVELPTFIDLDFFDWYDVYYVEGIHKYHLLNARNFLTMELERQSDIVRKQGDYYREAYFREYFYKYADPEPDYLEKTQLVTIKVFLRKKDNGEIHLTFRQRSNTYDCYYFKGETDPGKGTDRYAISKLPFTIEKNSDIMIFDKDGIKINNLSYGDGYITGLLHDREYEIIPEYSPIRKYEYSFTNMNSITVNTELAHRILYTNSIFPWNIENPEMLVFKSNGEIVTGDTLPTSGIIDIYTNYDLGFVEESDTIPNSISGFIPTNDFIGSLNDSELYTLVSTVLPEAAEDSGVLKTSVFPIMVEDYTDPNIASERSKVVANAEVKLHRVLGDGNKEYLFVDTPNTNEIDTFRVNMTALLDKEADSLKLTTDEDLDNLRYALWSIFCSTKEKSASILDSLYNKIPLSISAKKDPTSDYDDAAYVTINSDSPITGSEYIIIPCSANISASYIVLLHENTYNSNKYLEIKNVSLVKTVEYTTGKSALIYITPDNISSSAYTYLYIPNWISRDMNGSYTEIYTLKHSNS